MEYVGLGKTNLLVSRTAFGAMSLDCAEIEAFGDDAEEKSCAIVHQAYDGGINFFDVSHSNLTCERRLGAALHGIRHNVIVATKSSARTVADLRSDFQESLLNLESDCVELFQLENPDFVPLKDGEDGLYNELVRLRETGLIKHFGISTDNFDIAHQVVESGLYETLQFPFSVISSQKAVNFVRECEKKDIGFLASQPLNGGVVSNIPLAYGFLREFEPVVPLWGIHTQEELHQILYFSSHPPVVDEQFKREVENLRTFFN